MCKYCVTKDTSCDTLMHATYLHVISDQKYWINLITRGVDVVQVYNMVKFPVGSVY